MKQTISLKLETTDEQFSMLKETVERFNEACNWIAVVAFEKRTANKKVLQLLVYHEVRARFGLSSQMACLAIYKVCDAFVTARSLHKQHCTDTKERNKKRAAKSETLLPMPELTACVFRSLGAITYDSRIMRIVDAANVSLLTLQGRIVVPMRNGDYQAARIRFQKGQADLLLRDGVFYLSICIDLPTPPPADTTGFLGVDLGITEIATDSTGKQYSGEPVKSRRRRVEEHRRQLQRKGTKDAKRRLRKVSRKMSRFTRNVNHVISKAIVSTAAQLQKAIALEDLSGIRERDSVSYTLRKLLGSWSFFQLRTFIAYKAEQAGLPVVFVDPAYTSRTCSVCGYCDKENRKSQSRFFCLKCGFVANADINAAVNIGARAQLSERLIQSVPATG